MLISRFANKEDLELINIHAELAVDCAINKKSGVIGINQDTNKLSCIDFDKIKGKLTQMYLILFGSIVKV